MLKNIWHSWFSGEQRSPRTPLDTSAHFMLRYRQLPVGHLTLDHGRWRFAYTDEFRQSESLRPITEFPDLDRTYESDELWPFFFMRIPSSRQGAVEEFVRKEQIDSDDEVQLLRRFGRRTSANPFELVAVGTSEDELGSIPDQTQSGSSAG